MFSSPRLVENPQSRVGYRLEEEVGRGGFGVVYRAHRDGGREVAVKLIHRSDTNIRAKKIDVLYYVHT